MAAAQMAKDHLNQRDARVVPALADLVCNITFPETWYVDSAYSRSVTVDEFIKINTDNPDNAICAVIGPVHPRANEGASVFSEYLKIPQIAYATIDKRLTRRDDFPTFARGIPAAEDFAGAVAKLVQGDIWMRDFIGVIYDQSDYGEQFEDPLLEQEDVLGFSGKAAHVEQDEPETWEDAFGEVVEFGFHTVIFAEDRPAMLGNIAQVSVDMGIVGDEYLWIIAGDLVPPELFDTLRFEVDSAADRLLRGAALYTNYDPFVYEPDLDPFLEAWKAQDDELLDRLQALHPLDASHESYFVGEPGYFQETLPTEYASFLYDAIMTAGLAACVASAEDTSHVDEIFKIDFKGASGRVVFHADENARDPVGVKFGMYNVRPSDEIDEETNTRG
jgi:hypothetical protein